MVTLSGFLGLLADSCELTPGSRVSAVITFYLPLSIEEHRSKGTNGCTDSAFSQANWKVLLMPHQLWRELKTKTFSPSCHRGSRCLMKKSLRLWLHTSGKLLGLFFWGLQLPRRNKTAPQRSIRRCFLWIITA